MKNSVTSFKFWIGPGALLALVMAVLLTVDARAEATSTPDDECPGAHFCDPDSQEVPDLDGTLDEDRDEREDGPDDIGRDDEVQKSNSDGGFGKDVAQIGDGSATFHNARLDGRYGPRRGGRADGFCTDPNPYDPRDPYCGLGGSEFVTERLIINRPVRFESFEINMMLGRLQQQLRGYELTGVQVLVADVGGFRSAPGGRQSDLLLVINGRVEDSVRVFGNAHHGSGLTAYQLRPYNSVDVGFRGERIQVAVQGDVFVSEIQLSFRRIR